MEIVVVIQGIALEMRTVIVILLIVLTMTIVRVIVRQKPPNLPTHPKSLSLQWLPVSAYFSSCLTIFFGVEALSLSPLQKIISKR